MPSKPDSVIVVVITGKLYQHPYRFGPAPRGRRSFNGTIVFQRVMPAVT
jgi:hypothetical protein